MDHISKAKSREGHGQDQDKAAAEEGRKQRAQPEIGLMAHRLGNRGLGGRDQPGADEARSYQGLVGPWWL